MIAIVGAGRVGSMLAFLLCQKRLGDIVLVDVVKGLAVGEALDLEHTCSFDVKVRGSHKIEDIKGSRVVAIVAGLARTPGMKDRAELLKTNVGVVREISRKVKELAPEAVVLVITNQVDVTTWVALKETGFPRERVIGMGSLLDSQRFRYFLSQEIKDHSRDVEAMVIGEHGDSMVPLVSRARFRGKPVRELLSKGQIERALERTREAGAKLIGLKGYTNWAPAEAAARMIESIAKDKKETVPASVLLKGEYGMEGVCIGVPVRLGKGGAEKVVELELDKEEMGQLKKSGERVKKEIGKL